MGAEKSIPVYVHINAQKKSITTKQIQESAANVEYRLIQNMETNTDAFAQIIAVLDLQTEL